MKSPVIINLFGGPGVGKSTIAAGLFYNMKKSGYNVEYVSEYAKDLTYEERYNILSKDQLYVFAKQHRKILRLKDKVDFIITDSPLLLTIVYSGINPSEVYNNDSFFKFVIDTNNKYKNLNIVLNRNFDYEYKEEGRTQTLKEAMNISYRLQKIVEKTTTSHKILKSDDETIIKIMNMIKELTT